MIDNKNMIGRLECIQENVAKLTTSEIAYSMSMIIEEQSEGRVPDQELVDIMCRNIIKVEGDIRFILQIVDQVVKHAKQ